MYYLKKWIKLTVIAIPFIVVATMAIQIWRVPDYRHGESYVSYSPDGRYRLDYIYPQSGRTVQVFSSLEDNDVIAIVPKPLGIEIDARTSIWLCGDDNSDCYKHDIQTSDGVPVYFPPSLWRRLHAWLSIQFKDLENPQLKIVEIDSYYPPVTKN